MNFVTEGDIVLSVRLPLLQFLSPVSGPRLRPSHCHRHPLRAYRGKSYKQAGTVSTVGRKSSEPPVCIYVVDVTGAKRGGSGQCRPCGKLENKHS